MKITLFIILVFSFNLIQTIGAFAGTMLAMPFAILLLGAEQARLVLTAVGILSCIYPILSCHSSIDWKEVRKIGIYMSVGDSDCTGGSEIYVWDVDFSSIWAFSYRCGSSKFQTDKT